MLKQDKGLTEINGTISDIINELAALTLHVKTDCLNSGMTEDKFAEAFALTTSAQIMAQAGMTIEEVEEVLGMPINREKSYYKSERNNHE